MSERNEIKKGKSDACNLEEINFPLHSLWSLCCIVLNSKPSTKKNFVSKKITKYYYYYYFHNK